MCSSMETAFAPLALLCSLCWRQMAFVLVLQIMLGKEHKGLSVTIWSKEWVGDVVTGWLTQALRREKTCGVNLEDFLYSGVISTSQGSRCGCQHTPLFWSPVCVVMEPLGQGSYVLYLPLTSGTGGMSCVPWGPTKFNLCSCSYSKRAAATQSKNIRMNWS